MLNYDDKRDFYRMMLNTEVNITIIDEESTTRQVANCRDLSANGIAIELTHPIDIGKSIHVSVDSANNKVSSLDVQGKVVRVTEESDECFLIAITIDEID